MTPFKYGFAGPVDLTDGYGSFSVEILRAFTALNKSLAFNPLFGQNYEDLTEDALVHTRITGASAEWEFMHAPPFGVPYASGEKLVLWTMYEHSLLPAVWVTWINKADRVIVPSKWCKTMFEENGVVVPITVIPYSLAVFPYYVRKPHSRPFTFLQYGTLIDRKAPLKTIEAFKLAFPNGDESVRLIISTRNGAFEGGRIPETNDTRIAIQNISLNCKQLTGLLARSDCGVSLSRGEGFGLCPAQMGLTGIPTILGAHTGHLEYFRPDCFYRCDTTLSNGPEGFWYEPDVQHAAMLMRQAALDPNECYRRGLNAMRHLSQNFSRDSLIRNLGAFLNDLD